MHAHRVAVAETFDPLGRSDYASAFDVARRAEDDRSPEQWARAAFEGAPAALRAFIAVGWRYGLGFRLGPRASTAHVLGWKIVSSTPDAIVLDLQSPLATAQKVVRVQTARVVMTTFVRYERLAGRALWSAVTPVHHRTEPYLLGRAAAGN
jgi:hypothetical protein